MRGVLWWFIFRGRLGGVRSSLVLGGVEPILREYLIKIKKRSLDRVELGL